MVEAGVPHLPVQHGDPTAGLGPVPGALLLAGQGSLRPGQVSFPAAQMPGVADLLLGAVAARDRRERG